MCLYLSTNALSYSSWETNSDGGFSARRSIVGLVVRIVHLDTSVAAARKQFLVISSLVVKSQTLTTPSPLPEANRSSELGSLAMVYTPALVASLALHRGAWRLLLRRSASEGLDFLRVALSSSIEVARLCRCFADESLPLIFRITQVERIALWSFFNLASYFLCFEELDYLVAQCSGLPCRATMHTLNCISFFSGRHQSSTAEAIDISSLISAWNALR
ncbi:hypothetical protein KCU65_g215, partial [Aureobasidium melanogenum]